VYRFSGFELDPAQYQLRRGEEVVHLEPKAFRVLHLLIENRLRAVSKEEILAEVWPGVAVTDNVLTRVIAQLRKALGDPARVATMIETVPTIGYRFVAPVERGPARRAHQEPRPSRHPEPPDPSPHGPSPERPEPSTAAAHARRQPQSLWGRRRIWGVRRLWVALAAFAILGGAWWATQQAPSRLITARQPLPRQVSAGLGLDATPSFSPDGANLVYASDRSGRFELYSRSLSPGGKETPLTSDGGQNIYPRWSPDGKWIVYVAAARGGIFVIPALGGQPRRLTHDGTQPVWMPDSQRLVYRTGAQTALVSTEVYPNRPTALRMVTLDGDDREIVATDRLAGRPDSPAVSPDGRWILFACYRGVSRADLLAIRPNGSDLHTLFAFSRRMAVVNPVVDPSGRAIRFVAISSAKGLGIYRADVDPDSMTPQGEAQEVLNTGILAPRDLAMRPDGKGIALSLTSTESTLFTIPLDGRGQTTAPPQPFLQERNFRSTQPAWSPAGDRLAFSATRVGESGTVWVTAADGQGASPLSLGQRQAMAPAWARDGGAIYFSSLETNAAGHAERVVYSVNLADQSVKEHLRLAGAAGLPAVSPDGGAAAYHTLSPGPATLYLHRFGESEPRRLAAALTSPSYPVWLPDGSGLLAEAEHEASTHIFEIPLDGSPPVQRTKAPGLHWPFSVGPGGARIAFASWREGAWNVWWLDRRSGEERKLTPYQSLRSFVRYPAWSPTGDRIVFEFSESKGNIYTVEWP
jgi:Tol biopolymer transport system component/DNA-binding winged helix-turn-helix (wHTH) protein